MNFIFLGFQNLGFQYPVSNPTWYFIFHVSKFRTWKRLFSGLLLLGPLFDDVLWPYFLTVFFDNNFKAFLNQRAFIFLLIKPAVCRSRIPTTLLASPLSWKCSHLTSLSSQDNITLMAIALLIMYKQAGVSWSVLSVT